MIRDARRAPPKHSHTETQRPAAAIALTAAGHLEETHAPTPHETWKRCYHRYRYARRYHNPTDPDAE